MQQYIWIYIAIISVVAIVITIYDKIAAKHFTKHRIPEANLLCVGFLGGALCMYITMKIIRHKTRKKKFMIPLPIFIVLHVVAIILWKEGIIY